MLPGSRTWAVVADGMGGHEAGNVASQVVVDSIAELVEAATSEAQICGMLVGFGRTVRLVHLRVFKVGRFAFAGYSFDGPAPQGLDANAGYAEYTRSCRAAVRAIIRDSGVDLSRCILLAHDRATHLDREFPGLLLHLYGHIHTFDVRERAGTIFVKLRRRSGRRHNHERPNHNPEALRLSGGRFSGRANSKGGRRTALLSSVSTIMQS